MSATNGDESPKLACTFKRIGNVVTITIDGQKMSKQMTKEESDDLAKLVETYNKKQFATTKAKIMAAMQKNTKRMREKAEREQMKLKGEKTLAKKEVKAEKVVEKETVKLATSLSAGIKKGVEENELSDAELEELEKLIAQSKRVKPKAATQGSKRGGEY